LRFIKLPIMRYCIIFIFMLIACRRENQVAHVAQSDSTIFADTTYFEARRNTDTPMRQKIVAFAKTQLGVRYKYCSMTPEGGFDCSGFVNYVFNHFDIKVPRSSVEFTHEGTDVTPLERSEPGDLILFTGTNPKKRVVGHIGIIIANDTSGIHFIHASSGTEYSVTITQLNDYYMSRFVKVIRVL
jgi:cell wall-associated NlpC family hydrolase